MRHLTSTKSIFYSLLSLALVAVATVVMGQPVLTTDLVPALGTQVDAKFLTPSNFDPGPSGANITWDFSDLDGALDIHFAIIDPALAPGNDSFPSAEFVWHFVEFENYIYYSSTQDEIAQLGATNGSVDDINFMVINDNTEDGLHLPVSYNDEYVYDADFRNYLFGSFFGIGRRDGQVHADAYGTITTSYGTFSNVLRLKIISTSQGITSTQYAWFHPDSFIPVFVYESSSDPEEDASLYYSNISPVISSSKRITAFDGSISAKYVSSLDQLLIEMDLNESIHGFKFQLINSSGQQVHRGHIDFASQGKNKYAINVPSDLSNGIYYFQIMANEKRWSKTLYIAHD